MSRLYGVPNTLGSQLIQSAGPDSIPVPGYVVDDIESEFIGKAWPRSSMLGAEVSQDGSLFAGKPWEYNDYPTGARTAWSISGVTRDVYGSPLGGCTVRLFNTALNTLQDTQVSGADGTYQLMTVYTDAHYVVAYKAGGPDVAGVTVNTLVGL